MNMTQDASMTIEERSALLQHLEEIISKQGYNRADKLIDFILRRTVERYDHTMDILIKQFPEDKSSTMLERIAIIHSLLDLQTDLLLELTTERRGVIASPVYEREAWIQKWSAPS